MTPRQADLSKFIWISILIVILVLSISIVVLDYMQMRRGTVSVFSYLWDRLKREHKLEEKKVIARETPVESTVPVVSSVKEFKIALIIDDLGGNANILESIKTIKKPLSLAILPLEPYSQKIAQEAPKHNFEVLLHLPMEPYRYPEVDPGKGALLMEMRDEEIISTLNKDFKSLSNVVGINNHMGSRMTEDEFSMKLILEEAKKKGLFFVDSLTSNHSVAYNMAKEMGIKAARRQVFLDHEEDVAKIKSQLKLLKDIALKYGQAIGIGHARNITIAVVKEMIPELEKEGIRFVKVSELVD